MQYTQLQRTALALMSSALLSLTALAQVQKPDLIVESVAPTGLTVNPQNLQIGGTVDVTLKNVGTVPSPACSGIIFSDRGTLNGVYDAGTDVVHGVFSAPALAVGASATVSASVSGQVRFVGALLYAFVDDANTVDEINEGNNLSNTGFRCRVARTGLMDISQKWFWGSSTVRPDYLNVTGTPLVADLDRDGLPEVIFATTNSTDGNPHQPGYLRVVRGVDGTEIFTNADVLIDTSIAMAVGDIDLDGYLEIVAVTYRDTRSAPLFIGQRAIVAFSYNGILKGQTAEYTYGTSGAIAIANVDGVGAPEVIFGSRVFKGTDGTLMWEGIGTEGSTTFGTIVKVGPFSFAADLDLDGNLEVIAGPTVYNGTDGSVKWRNQQVPDGFPVVANFDNDPKAEVLIVSNGTVYLLDDNGVLLSSLFIPEFLTTAYWSGPPVVGNLDDDPELEIGIGGDNIYIVLNHDLTRKWFTRVVQAKAPISSSFYDFDGNSVNEIVFTDVNRLRILRATDGLEIGFFPSTTCKWSELATIADVDVDGSADIILASNNNCFSGTRPRGLFAVESASRSWVSTRSIWNQHAYSITNVNDDGSIPAYPTPNWLVPEYNNFRTNVQGSFPAAATPDLTASFLRRCPIPDTNGDFNFVLRIGNGGAGSLAPTTIAVDFYRGDPDNGGQFLQRVSVNTQTLQPDQYQDVVVPAPDGIVCSDVYAVVDADGQITECNETNNKYGLYIPIPGDVNVDRIVDDADLLEVLFDFGRVVGADEVVPADINCDGIVDDADLLIALFNFGEECP